MIGGLPAVFWRRFVTAFLAFSASVSLAAGDDGLAAWSEDEVSLPPTSVPARPVKFDIGGGSDNRFAVDASTIVVGRDGVVRFTSVVVSAAGATNVVFEGIRCATRERRSYAFGRADGTWSRARSERWTPIEPRAINAYGNILYREFFCPNGGIVRDVAEAVMALDAGGHPAARLRK